LEPLLELELLLAVELLELELPLALEPRRPLEAPVSPREPELFRLPPVPLLAAPELAFSLDTSAFFFDFVSLLAE